jgi:hypothetical protein
MTATSTMAASLYQLDGEGLSIIYNDRDNTLTVDLDEQQHLSGEHAAHTKALSHLGTLITAELLSSTRNGARITITVLVPEVGWPPSRAPHAADISGVAIITRNFRNVVGGAPPVLEHYDTVVTLTGTART